MDPITQNPNTGGGKGSKWATFGVYLAGLIVLVTIVTLIFRACA